jgi:hypothetical protein
MEGYQKQKKFWHKQERDQKGCDCKKGLLYFSSQGEPALTLICTTTFLPRTCGGHITPNKYQIWSKKPWFNLNMFIIELSVKSHD